MLNTCIPCHYSCHTSPATTPSSSSIATVLYLVVLLEQLHPEVLMGVSTGIRLAWVLCVFLIGMHQTSYTIDLCSIQCLLTPDSDLFLEKDTYRCLSALLKHYCQPHLQQSLILSPASTLGLPSFYDL